MSKNEVKQFDYEELANYLLDYLCLLKGSDGAIRLLMIAGYDPDQVEDLGFDREDISRIFESEK